MKNVHGGCLMTFADYCLFALTSRELQGPGITFSVGCEFPDTAKEGAGRISRRNDPDRRLPDLLRSILKAGERSLRPKPAAIAAE